MCAEVISATDADRSLREPRRATARARDRRPEVAGHAAPVRCHTGGGVLRAHDVENEVELDDPGVADEDDPNDPA